MKPITHYNYTTGDALKLLRTSNGYTKTYVADCIDMCPSTVANHEFSNSYPDMYAISRYCILYNLELYEFYHLVAMLHDDTIPPLVTSDIRKLALRKLLTE